MHTSRFSTVLLAVSLGLVSVGCNSGDGNNVADGGSNQGGGGDPGDPGGGGGDGFDTETLDGIDLDGSTSRIVDLPESVDPLFRDVFSRYAAVETTGGRIHILAQAGVTDDKIRRSREVLKQHLAPVAGSAQGADKEDVIAAMINQGATAAIFSSSSAIDLNDAAVNAYLIGANAAGVAIPQERIVLEGSSAYMATNPAEDNTFGVMAALVHKAGMRPARAAFAAELDTLATAAIADGLFTPDTDVPDDQLISAFLVTAMDVHSGVFGHDPSGSGLAEGVTGTLQAKDRDDLAAALPQTSAWLEGFFTTGHDFEVILPTSFTGNFDCLRRSWNPYSARSQHLRDIQMSGTNSGEIFAAPFDSKITGNSGNNNLKGRRGYDTVDGGDCFDTAIFSGPLSDYTVEILSDRVIVEDVLGGHEQTDILFGIERLQFTDGGFNL